MLSYLTYPASKIPYSPPFLSSFHSFGSFFGRSDLSYTGTGAPLVICPLSGENLWRVYYDIVGSRNDSRFGLYIDFTYNSYVPFSKSSRYNQWLVDSYSSFPFSSPAGADGCFSLLSYINQSFPDNKLSLSDLKTTNYLNSLYLRDWSPKYLSTSTDVFFNISSIFIFIAIVAVAIRLFIYPFWRKIKK